MMSTGLSLRLQTGFDKKLEGPGTVRERLRFAGLPAMLLFGAHLAEGRLVTLGLEDRIVAEAL